SPRANQLAPVDEVAKGLPESGTVFDLQPALYVLYVPRLLGMVVRELQHSVDFSFWHRRSVARRGARGSWGHRQGGLGVLIEGMAEIRSVYLTFPNEDSALAIARTLVEEHLVACV